MERPSGHDIIVIGASAGGVEALREIAAEFPADLPAAVMVVLHVPATGTSSLPTILGRDGPLSAAHAIDGDPICRGRILVAPPNQHLLLRSDHLRLSRGPKENRQRPAVDPLFRSAARFHGRRVVGVVLSGSLDDGTAGLIAIKGRGGVAIAQDPATALFDSMPRHAIEAVAVDIIASPSGIAGEIDRLARTPVPAEELPVSHELDLETRIADADAAVLNGDDHPGTPASLACPECGGTLWELREGELLRYRCRVGHAFSSNSLLDEQAEQLEDALWIALRNLEEQASLHRRLAAHASLRGKQKTAQRFQEQERDVLSKADVVRGVLSLNDANGPHRDR